MHTGTAALHPRIWGPTVRFPYSKTLHCDVRSNRVTCDARRSLTFFFLFLSLRKTFLIQIRVNIMKAGENPVRKVKHFFILIAIYSIGYCCLSCILFFVGVYQFFHFFLFLFLLFHLSFFFVLLCSWIEVSRLGARSATPCHAVLCRQSSTRATADAAAPETAKIAASPYSGWAAVCFGLRADVARM